MRRPTRSASKAPILAPILALCLASGSVWAQASVTDPARRLVEQAQQITTDQGRDAAATFLEAALSEMEGAGNGAPADLARLEHGVGRLRLEQDQDEEAVAWLRRAQARLETLPDAPPDLQIAVWRDLGSAYQGMVRPAEQLRAHTAMATLSEQVNGLGHPDTVHALFLVAGAHGQAFDYAAELSTLRDALVRALANPQANARNLGEIYRTMARNLLYQENNAAEALAVLDLAVEAVSESTGPVSMLMASTHDARGSVLGRMGRHDAAIASHRRAVATIEAFAETPGQADVPQVRIDRAIYLHNLAFALNKAGDFQAAASAYEDMAEAFASLLGPDHPVTVFANRGRALNLISLGRHYAGVALLEDTLDRFAPLADPTELRLITLRTDLAGAYLTDGRQLDDARRLLMEAADAVHVLAERRASHDVLGPREIESQRDVFQNQVRVAWRLNTDTPARPAPTSPEEPSAALEAARRICALVCDGGAGVAALREAAALAERTGVAVAPAPNGALLWGDEGGRVPGLLSAETLFARADILSGAQQPIARGFQPAAIVYTTVLGADEALRLQARPDAGALAVVHAAGAPEARLDLQVLRAPDQPACAPTGDPDHRRCRFTPDDEAAVSIHVRNTGPFRTRVFIASN